MNRQIFPLEFQKVLVLKQSNYAHLAKAMTRRGYRATKQFIGMLGTGQRKVPALQLQRMCETLQCTDIERRRLHIAACLDQGYDVGDLNA